MQGIRGLWALLEHSPVYCKFRLTLIDISGCGWAVCCPVGSIGMSANKGQFKE